MYKCLPVAFGVDISVNKSNFFHFDPATHIVTDLGEDRVRISRRIDGLHEIYNSLISNFTDMAGTPVATTAAELTEYFSQGTENIKAGEGIIVTNKTVSVVAGGPATLGGFKVGTGLTVDGSGKLSASAVSETTLVLNNEAEMLALATEVLRPYRVIRLDTKRLYFLNAGDSPAVIGNWFVGPSIETTVLSFIGRTGVVVAEFGDYTQDLVPLIDSETAVKYKWVSVGDKLFLENIDTQERREIADSSDLTSLQSSFTNLSDTVTNASTGLVKKVGDLEQKTAALDSTVNSTTTGLVDKVKALEARPIGGDYSSAITALQAKDKEIENLATFVNQKVDSTAANTVVLDRRISDIELNGSGTNYGPQISALQAKDVAQDERLSTAETSLLTKASLVDGKVPYEQLPEFPVGRKVNVANKAERLALPAFGDLTIAYESDTADAWGLDANDDPSVEDNWSKLGSAQAVGVTSFNGRTGAIGGQTGDYNTGQITELTTKRFVTNTQIAAWDAKESTTGSQAKADAVKSYANSTFLLKSEKGAVSGVAPLGADSKVPSQYLPSTIGVSRNYYDKKTNTIGAWYANNFTDREVLVYISTTTSTDPSRQLNVLLRDNKGGAQITIKSPMVGASFDHTSQLTVVLPQGWSYSLIATGGTTASTIESWYELA